MEECHFCFITTMNLEYGCVCSYTSCVENARWSTSSCFQMNTYQWERSSTWILDKSTWQHKCCFAAEEMWSCFADSLSCIFQLWSTPMSGTTEHTSTLEKSALPLARNMIKTVMLCFYNVSWLYSCPWLCSHTSQIKPKPKLAS